MGDRAFCIIVLRIAALETFSEMDKMHIQTILAQDHALNGEVNAFHSHIPTYAFQVKQLHTDFSESAQSIAWALKAWDGKYTLTMIDEGGGVCWTNCPNIRELPLMLGRMPTPHNVLRMQPQWHTTFMELADVIAQRSKDPSTQVGAVIVAEDKRQIAIGYNGFPASVRDDKSVLNKTHAFTHDNTFIAVKPEPTPVGAPFANKYDLMIHAEMNAVLNSPFSVRDCSMYCTHIPCAVCAKFIVASGISRVYYRGATGKTDMGYDKTRLIFDLGQVEFIEYNQG